MKELAMKCNNTDIYIDIIRLWISKNLGRFYVFNSR